MVGWTQYHYQQCWWLVKKFLLVSFKFDPFELLRNADNFELINDVSPAFRQHKQLKILFGRRYREQSCFELKSHSERLGLRNLFRWLDQLGLRNRKQIAELCVFVVSRRE